MAHQNDPVTIREMRNSLKAVNGPVTNPNTATVFNFIRFTLGLIIDYLAQNQGGGGATNTIGVAEDSVVQGLASVLNFNDNLTVDLTGGIATINASGGGGATTVNTVTDPTTGTLPEAEIVGFDKVFFDSVSGDGDNPLVIPTLPADEPLGKTLTLHSTYPLVIEGELGVLIFPPPFGEELVVPPGTSNIMLTLELRAANDWAITGLVTTAPPV